MAVERARPSGSGWAALAADHLARYSFGAQFAQHRRVLDVGTGHGYGALMLLQAGASSVQACDVDSAVVGEASKLYRGAGLRYFVDDAEQLRHVEAPVDLVCSFENIEHLENPQRFVEAAARVLTHGGLMICSTPDRQATPPFVRGRPANPYHRNEWYREEFESLLAVGFEYVEILTQVRSFSLTARESGVAALEKHLAYLWRNPASRAVRVVRRFLFGARDSWWSVRGLAAQSAADYPVLTQQAAGFHGAPFCHVAVCKVPRTATGR